ncbi:hypothetical protein [Marinomonas mediterranea]|nr:hypothetical protein [Marinomonas mediterranea]
MRLREEFALSIWQEKRLTGLYAALFNKLAGQLRQLQRWPYMGIK